MSYKNKQQGFTIVELLIVIVVIGILAALVITTFTGIQQKARNTERQTDIKAIHGQVEAYYASKGYYPTFDHLNDSTWRTANMKGLDQEALKDPKGTAFALAATSSATSYGYAVGTSAGTATSCASDETTCATYVLTATMEGGDPAFTKTNLN